MQSVTIWSDIHCPWAAVAVHRLRRARDELRLEVGFDHRPWPLELVNGHGTPRHTLASEVAVLANHEPDVFSAYKGDSWPSTFLPAFELVAAARQVQGMALAEEVDYALRLAFFRHSIDVSVESGLRKALELTQKTGDVDVDAVIDVWRNGAVRREVFADFERSKELSIEGSPHVFWADGSDNHNPGMTEFKTVRGIPHITRAEPHEVKRLLLETTRS